MYYNFIYEIVRLISKKFQQNLKNCVSNSDLGVVGLNVETQLMMMAHDEENQVTFGEWDLSIHANILWYHHSCLIGMKIAFVAWQQ